MLGYWQDWSFAYTIPGESLRWIGEDVFPQQQLNGLLCRAVDEGEAGVARQVEGKTGLFAHSDSLLKEFRFASGVRALF